jgi:chromosome partitioning protein
MDTLREDYTLTPPELKEILNLSVQGVHHTFKANSIESVLIKRKHRVKSAQIRKLFLARGYTYHQEVISFQVVKGGTGKTSISHSFAIRANQYGARVLCIDIDQQGNLTQAFGVDSTNFDTILDVIKNKQSLTDIILPITPSLHLIPSNMNNSVLDRYLQVEREPLEYIFTDMLNKIRNQYDYIIFDCPPAISCANTAATLASNRIIIPVNPDKFSMEGLKITVEEAARLNAKYKKTSPCINILFNRYDARKSSSSEYLKQLMSNDVYKDLMLNTFIRDNADISNFIRHKESIFDSTKNSYAREDLDLFCREIMGLDSFAKAIQ